MSALARISTTTVPIGGGRNLSECFFIAIVYDAREQLHFGRK
jgi:hypothetical protein